MAEFSVDDVDLDAEGADPQSGDDPGGDLDPVLEAAEQAARQEALEGEPEGVTPPTEEGEEPDWTTQVFGEDVELPEDLQGKSPREFIETFNTMRNTAQNLANYLQQFQQQGQQPVQPGQPPVQQPQPEPEESIFGDVDLLDLDGQGLEQKLDQFFQRKATPLVSQLQQQVLQQSVMNAYGQAQQLPYFERYQDEIMSIANTADPAELASPQAWQLIHNHVVANHLDDIARERIEEASSKQPPAPFTETGSGVPAQRGGQQQQDSGLTAMEREIAVGLGVPPEVAAKMKAIRQGG